MFGGAIILSRFEGTIFGEIISFIDNQTNLFEITRWDKIFHRIAIEKTKLDSAESAAVRAYVVKPMKFQDFVDAVKQLSGFWANVNEVPESLHGEDA